jgi:hypothetical protein
MMVWRRGLAVYVMTESAEFCSVGFRWCRLGNNAMIRVLLFALALLALLRGPYVVSYQPCQMHLGPC